jgi:hypothetical protein
MMGQGIPHGLIVGLEHDLLTFINAVGLFRRNDLLKRPNAFLDGSIGSGISARFNLNLNLDFVTSHLTLLSKGWLTSGLAPVK